MFETKRELGVIYSEQEPGVIHCFRNTGETPFALLRSPKAAGGCYWTVIYRDPGSANPFSGPVTALFINQQAAMLDLTRAINGRSGYQFGLEDCVQAEPKEYTEPEKIIPHMCLICNRNTSGCDRVAFYSAEGELAGSALVEHSANVLMSRNGELIPADNRLKDCRIKFEYADEIEDVLPTSFQTLIKKTHDDVKAVVAVVDLNADELFRGDLQAFERFWIRNGDEASGLATLHDWLVARYYVNSEAANTEALKQQWQQAIPSNYVSCTKSLTPRCRSWSTTFPGPARARP